MRRPSYFRVRSGLPLDCLLQRGCRFFALILVCGWAAGCVPAYEAKLEGARARGDLDAAAELLQRASERAPDDPVLLREQGILAFERGDPAAAREILGRALVNSPDDERAILHAAAASEQAGLWEEATERYHEAGDLALPPEVATAVDCQWAAVDEKRLSSLVAARLAAEQSGTLPAPTRILMLPFAAPQQSVALNLRLGLAALLADDWERVTDPAAVPFTELTAFLAALSVPVDEPITAETRERLAQLTGARYVVGGQLSELNDVVSVAPVLIDRVAETGAPREWRLEYRQSRVATLVDLERTLLHHITSTLDLELPADEQAARLFAAESGLAITLFGEAERLRRSGDRAQAVERLDGSLGLDPDFRPAAEARVKLGDCTAVAGDPTAVLTAHAAAVRRERDRAASRELLSATSAAADRVGGAEGEGKDLSLNRPAASGATSFTVRVPR
jgi:tetratricopeptide (TPR) repeat protein